MHSRLTVVAALVLSLTCPGFAQRRPVLDQIDLPHAYYYREMYLPQLTSGPSSVAWSPDSRELAYSMAGSLWRQTLDSKDAYQLTDGPGYDYQPDWSPDGKSIVYVSYQKSAMELWLLDLASGESTQLTSGGAVNVEPRWSPDGKQLVFVSTAYNKRFHIFRAEVENGKLTNMVRLTGEAKSPLPRYYYSAYDMEISPVWTHDGKEILFVSNRGHIHGTGGLWRMKAEPGAPAREIHYEETNWKARPDFSPDDSRIVYSSYLGRQWHQLWLMPANGGDAFPLTYGDWDDTNARWSPDGQHIAFILNASGNTRLAVTPFPGAAPQHIRATAHRLRPPATLKVRVENEQGGPTSARVSVMDADGRTYIPEAEVLRADDSFDRSERPFEEHYVEVLGTETFRGHPGIVHLEVMKGFECQVERRQLDLHGGTDDVVVVRLRRLPAVQSRGERWVSADLHVHMNYGGMYRNSPGELVRQANAEDLQVVNNLIVNKEQRFPDIDHTVGPDPASTLNQLLTHGQEFHTSYWGHRGILGLKTHILLPGYAGYPNTAAASLYPMNADVYDMAHQQGALVGAVHPFDEIPDPSANPPRRVTDELPVDVALGKIDYLEILGFSDHRSTAAVWYRLLNLGFHLPAGAGTDAMMNFASLRGPVGLNRVYVRVSEKFSPPQADSRSESGAAWQSQLEESSAAFFEGLKKGRTFATNGPLLDFTLGGKGVGDELNFDGASAVVGFTATLRSIVPVDHLEVVCNGRVAQSLLVHGPKAAADFTGAIPVKESGWCVLRASSDKPEYPVLDPYVYATTSPIYVTIGGQKPRSPADANYFVAWIDRVIEITSQYPDWNSAGEREYVLKRLAEGKAVFEKMQ